MYRFARFAVAFWVVSCAASRLSAEEREAAPEQPRFAKFDQVALIQLGQVWREFKAYRAQQVVFREEISALEQQWREASPYGESLEELHELRSTLPKAQKAKVDRAIEMWKEVKAKAEQLEAKEEQAREGAQRDIHQQIAEYCQENDIRLVLEYYPAIYSYEGTFCGNSRMDPPRIKDLLIVYEKDLDITRAIIERLNAAHPVAGPTE